MGRFLSWISFLIVLPCIKSFTSPLMSERFHSRPSQLSLSSQNNEGCFSKQSSQRRCMSYHIIAAPSTEDLASRMAEECPDRFHYHPTAWNKFPDGTDNIEIGGFTPHNVLSDQHVLFLASFDNNDTTLSQFQVLICLLQSFIKSMTIVLPYSPTGTMERVVREGQVATAATYAHMFSTLPGTGTRLMVYDLHTLQNRFYLHGHAVASLHTAIPLLQLYGEFDAVAFPDDGAAKRFGPMFENVDTIVCGKTRDGDERRVTIQDGDAQGKRIVIVDDLVQTGGTLYESAKVLKAAGAAQVDAYVTHAVFPKQSYKRFAEGGDRYGAITKFYVTNSIPTVTKELEGLSPFCVLDLMDLIIYDLDHYSSNGFLEEQKKKNKS